MMEVGATNITHIKCVAKDIEPFDSKQKYSQEGEERTIVLSGLRTCRYDEPDREELGRMNSFRLLKALLLFIFGELSKGDSECGLSPDPRLGQSCRWLDILENGSSSCFSSF